MSSRGKPAGSGHTSHRLPAVRTEERSLVKPLLTATESTAAGKALRDKLAREEHAHWKTDKRRHDPIRLLRASDGERLQELVPIRYGRMLQSPFAFYRGSAAIMASDLARMPVTGIRVQACGDCHLANFGGFATPERNILFDINDFDETLPGPWEWDVKRLAASFVLAARSLGLSDGKGRDAAVESVRSYREHMREFAEMHPLELWYARIDQNDFLAALPKDVRANVAKRLKKAAKSSGSEMDLPKLADVTRGKIRINDSPPLIFHPEAARGLEFQKIIEQVFEAYRETLAEDRRFLLDQYQFVDAAIKVVGVGSVGRRCWIALMMSSSNHPLFLQFKEAVASVLEPYAGKSAHGHHGQRVVVGQRMMQPASDVFLGWVTAPNGRQFYVRQLRDAKIKPLIESWNAEILTLYADACGWVLARAHAKTGDQCAIAGYLGGSDAFDQAIGDFALAYADQAERDHAALKAAVRSGKVSAYLEG
ncbi:MAG TPA: DUF2252 domain-containing protein [Stellaceae bacterium]|nr:DUF2252 domain-containing protein [Stellaceae bacterium]